jgi:Protein of unknown function (DUF3892)
MPKEGTMSDVQVTCITKPDRENTHEAITHLGNSTGTWTVAQVVAWIETRTNTFYTLVGGKRADVLVRESPRGHKYVQTAADGYYNNNLLALTECPI